MLLVAHCHFRATLAGIYTIIVCKSYLTLVFSSSQGQAHGETQVISCLVNNYQSIVADCQREVSRAVRMALWEYQPQLALTSKQAACHSLLLMPLLDTFLVVGSAAA